MGIIRLSSLILLILLTACSPEQRLNRLLSKHPELIKTETVYDTVIIKSVTYDTLFKYTQDTVVIHKDRLTMKYFYNNHDSLIYLSGMCESDTLIVEKQVTSLNPVDSWSNTIKNNFGWVLFAFVLLFLVILILLRK